nr:unnamed protein product [Callosobruchus analis]
MEVLTKEVLAELKKEYHKCKSTVDEESAQIDSESKIDELLKKTEQDSSEYMKLLSMKASVLYEKAKMCLAKNQFETCKELLEKGLSIITDHSEHLQIHFLYLRIVNYLSYVLSRTGELEKAKNLLEGIVNAESKIEPLVYSTDDLFSNNQVDQAIAKSKIHKLVINNMQMLGWIYGKLGLTDQYADTVHKSLQKELDTTDGDPIQWAVRCYRLASLFLAQGKWANARYHLTAAQMVLDPLEMAMNTNTAVLYRVQADLARVWVNYGLHLFSSSKKILIEKAFTDNPTIKPITQIPEFQFTGMEVHLPNVPAKEIEDNQEARCLFSHTHTWLKRARLYYTLRDFPVQYVNIILELSELYRFQSFYEKDIDSQYAVQRKRYEALETLSNILKEVRPNCYAAVNLEIIREIIEVQMEMMQLNLKRIYGPKEEMTFSSEDDLRKRIDTVADIHNRIESLCAETNNCAQAERQDSQEFEEKFSRSAKKVEERERERISEHAHELETRNTNLHTKTEPKTEEIAEKKIEGCEEKEERNGEGEGQQPVTSPIM